MAKKKINKEVETTEIIEQEKEVVEADKIITVKALQTVRDGETGKVHVIGETFQIASSRLKGNEKFLKKV